MNTKNITKTIFFAFLFIFICAHTVHAQRPPQKDWRLMLGAGGVMFPTYEGSDEYKVWLLPYVDFAYKDILAINPINGIRYKAYAYEDFEFGLGLEYDSGRDQDESDRLRGMGDIGATVEVILYGEYRYRKFTAKLDLMHDMFGGHSGSTVEMEASYRVRLTDVMMVMPAMGFTYAEDKYMESFFGVSRKQADRSVLPAFDAGAGIKSISLKIPMLYRIDAQWSLFSFVKYELLLGDARNSPVTETRNQFVGAMALGYNF